MPCFSKEFVKDSYGFARVHALLPALSKEPKENLKAKVVDATLTVYQVKGGNRILFAKIEKHATQTNLYEVEFNAAQATADWFPVYWLPWQDDSTYRITLKKSSKVSVVDRDDRVVNPDFFFTAALNGCLVHVDGDPYEPTVYHLNAKTHPVDQAPKQYTPGEWNFFMKAQHMETQAASAQTTIRKSASHYAPQSVNAFQYMGNNASDKAMDEQQAKAAKLLGTTFKEVTPINLGIVFGKRDSTGIWNFYYQSLSHYIYTKNGLRFDEWIVNDCRRFWPGSDIQKPIPIVFADDDEPVVEEF